jgi:hypothetical protein
MAIADSNAPLGPQARNLAGEVFGRLTVLSFAGRCGKHLTWNCVCDCGNKTVVLSTSLTSGVTQSCGCLHKERFSRKTHGRSQSGSYVSWHHMILRCTEPNHVGYENYGGRGISVCERWMVFENFLADMGERPDGKSIDRHPDPNGNYEPGNCRWATRSEQNSSRRLRKPRKGARLYPYNGQMLSAGRLAAIANLPYHILDNRLRLGWSAERAMSTPVDLSKSHSRTYRTRHTGGETIQGFF